MDSTTFMKKFLNYRAGRASEKKISSNGHLFDVDHEKDAVDRWYADESCGPMNTSDLVMLINNGFDQCEGACDSRDVIGEGDCYCIRSLFPHPAFYSLYIELRKLKVISEVLTALFSGEKEKS